MVSTRTPAGPNHVQPGTLGTPRDASANAATNPTIAKPVNNHAGHTNRERRNLLTPNAQPRCPPDRKHPLSHLLSHQRTR